MPFFFFSLDYFLYLLLCPSLTSLNQLLSFWFLTSLIPLCISLFDFCVVRTNYIILDIQFNSTLTIIILNTFSFLSHYVLYATIVIPTGTLIYPIINMLPSCQGRFVVSFSGRRGSIVNSIKKLVLS